MRKTILRVMTPVILIFVIFTTSCNGYTNALVLTYAFRKAESAAMKSPEMQAKITDIEVRRKINTLEGTFDSAWNCAFVAYKTAAEATPEGQEVKVALGDFAPCMANAWGAAYQIIQTVRVFEPKFLETVITYDLPSGAKISVSAKDFSSITIPEGMALAPKTKMFAEKK